MFVSLLLCFEFCTCLALLSFYVTERPFFVLGDRMGSKSYRPSFPGPGNVISPNPGVVVTLLYVQLPLGLVSQESLAQCVVSCSVQKDAQEHIFCVAAATNQFSRCRTSACYLFLVTAQSLADKRTR